MNYSSCPDHSHSTSDDSCLNESSLKRITNARKRWRILAKVLRRNSLESVNSSTSSIDILSSDTTPSENSSPQTSLDSNEETSLSVRSFDGFNLVQQSPVPYGSSQELLGNQDEDWYRYRMNIKENCYEINVHHINRLWTAQDLIGFNNTGNICVWPSEETLTYYVLDNIRDYKNSNVLELGGGMTSLAGLMIAKYGNPFLVQLSDGNSLSVDNVKISLRLNYFNCFTKASILKWEAVKSRNILEHEMYNLILCADCLFFDESRQALVETIDFYLSPKPNSRALIMAPRRGQTLQLTEYWKSNDRAFCEFCKCWYADNKASKEFHENGKKHKINVQKRISEISRKSYKDAQNERKMEENIRKMNENAMKAYAGDLAAGADYSARKENERSAAAAARSAIGPQVDPFAIKLPEDDYERPLTKAEEEKAQSLWCEAKSDEGHTYYWNVKTGESVWEEPKEGYMKYEEYLKIQHEAEQKATQEVVKQSEEFVKNADEIAAAYNRERLKAYRKITKPDSESEDDDNDKNGEKKKKKKKKVDEKYGWENPEEAARPVGQWQTVEAPRPQAPIDLQLPTKYEPVAFVPSEPEPVPMKKFKEKTITSVDADEPGFFKKRKIAGGSRNVRKRVDDD
uniref:Calmodulin-lysine N-methyltransferase n=1 Tax=Culicoides sonorensis TaxID=179676 RepID=A0A336LS45_CULSO